MKTDDNPLKSAYELAMERLKAEDRDGGKQERKSLTPKQKQEISRLRQEATAKLAELEILRSERMAACADDPAKREQEEAHYQTDRRRVDSSLESAIAKIKK